MRALLFCLSLLLSSSALFSSALAQVPGPSFEDVISLESVGSPAISPDGQHVAFTVRSTDWDDNGYDTEIWLSKHGEVPFQLTRTADGSSSSPKWSPDGRWISFTANRGDDNQVFAIGAMGGEAFPLTAHKGGVSGYDWSPDGSQIAFTATDPKSDELEAREDQYGSWSYDEGDQRMTHLWVVPVSLEGPGSADSPASVDGTASVDGPGSTDSPASMDGPGEARRLTEGDHLTVRGFDWAPDGARIAIEHATDASILGFMSADISLVDVESGDMTGLVSTPGSDSSPTWSPDGTWLMYWSADGNTTSNFYAPSVMKLISADGTDSFSILSDFNENLSGGWWLKDGLYFTAYQKTKRFLYRADPQADTITAVEGLPERIGAVSFSEDGSRMAFSAGDAVTLNEIYVSASDGSGVQRITDMTGQLDGWSIGTSETVRWTSRDGTEIEGVLFKSDDFDPSRQYPLLVNIHGGPTGIDYPTPIDSYVYPITQWLAKGAVVLQPNYRGSAGYGHEFRALNVRNLGVGDMWDVMSGVDYLIGEGFVDEDRMGAMGWSQGGYISAFLTTNTDRFKAISVGAGISNWMTYYVNTDIHPFTRQYLQADPWRDPEIYAKTSPMTNILQASTPTLIQHGEFDRRVPIPNAYELLQGLRDLDVPAELIVYKGFGHGISKPKERLAATWHNWQWFGKYIWGEDLEMPLEMDDDE